MMEPRQRDPEPAQTGWRWLLVPWCAGLVAIILLNLAVRNSELITGRYIAGGVPPVAAFALVLVLMGLQATLGRFGERWRLSRRQILVAYLMLTIAAPLCGAYLVRAWLPHLVALPYWAEKKPDLPGLMAMLDWLPPWVGPRSAEAVTAYWEGLHHAGAVPWREWLRPLAMWSVFFAALGVAMYCFMALVQRQWIRAERLTFPILFLPLTLTDTADAGPASRLWLKPWFWIAVGLTLVFNGLNVAHCIVPALWAPGFQTSLAPYFTERPWTPFASIRLFYMIELIGFGYFIPLEVSFTVWFSYLLIKFLAVGGIAMGYERPGFPFIHEQCAGAHLAVFLLIGYGLRHHVAGLWRSLWRGESESERVAWIGLAVSLGVMLWFMVFTGVPIAVAALYLAVLLVFVLVYARVRAETGAPIEFTYPYWMPKNLVTWTFTAGEIAAQRGLRGPVAFGLFSWLSRHHFDKSMAAYNIDAFKLAEVSHIPRSALAVTIGLAFVVGLAAATWTHLDAYYDVGTNLASGSLGRGEYRATVALDEFVRTANDLANAAPRPWDRISYVGLGFGVAGLIGLARNTIPGWPLHPLGYIIGTAYGDHNTAIFPMLVAWAAKATIQRVGGLRAYRAGIPFFVGLIAGHFFFAGVCWPILSVILGPETSQAYHLYFGG